MRSSFSLVLSFALSLSCWLGFAASASAATEAWYRFDNDTVAPVTEDETGNHDGTLVNAPSPSASVGQNPLAQNGAANTTSMDLDLASTQYVSVPHDAALSFGGQPWTIEAFVALASFPTSPVADPPFGTAGMWIAQKKEAPNPSNVTDYFQEYGFMISGNRGNLAPGLVVYARPDQQADPENYVTTGRELQVEMADGTDIFAFTSSLVVPAVPGQWVHVSASYDGDRSVHFTLDVDLSDDAIDFSETVTAPVGTVINPIAGTGSVFIGGKKRGDGAPQQLMDGEIDEVRFSSGSLLESELLAAAPAAPPPSVPALGGPGAGLLVLMIGAGGVLLAVRRGTIV